MAGWGPGWSRVAVGVSGALGAYLVLAADWGPHPHVFSPVRAKVKAAATAALGAGEGGERSPRE